MNNEEALVNQRSTKEMCHGVRSCEGNVIKEENDVSTSCHDITPLLQSMSQRQNPSSSRMVAKVVNEK